jgi:hypothetical protein
MLYAEGGVPRPAVETRARECLPGCKPVSVPLAGRRSFVWAGHCCTALATYPEVVTERAAPAPLFGLAPHGVCPASRIAPAAVRSYRTFSPLPSRRTRRYVFCGTFRERRFERRPPAVSRHAALWRPDFPPANASDHPSGRRFHTITRHPGLCVP